MGRASIAAAPGRIDSFDALRAAGALIVVGLHDAIAYMNVPLMSIVWPVREPGGPVFDFLARYGNALAMPAFFLAAGHFSAISWAARGANPFLTRRIRRLLIPFAIGIFTLLPLCYAVWSWGWLRSGEATLEEVIEVNFQNPEIAGKLYGPAHLWFLEYLLLLTLAFWAYCRWRERKPRGAAGSPGGGFSREVASPWRALWLAVPSALCLAVTLEPLLRFTNSFVPAPGRLLYYGSFFFGGVWLAASGETLRRLARGAGIAAALSIAVAIPALASVAPYLAAPHDPPLSARLPIAAGFSLFVWLSLLGGLGLSLRLPDSVRPTIRHLSNASYWIYLVHMPFLAASQILLAGSALPAAAKFSIVFALTVAFCLVTYRLAARRARNGRVAARQAAADDDGLPRALVTAPIARDAADRLPGERKRGASVRSRVEAEVERDSLWPVGWARPRNDRNHCSVVIAEEMVHASEAHQADLRR